jgi:hypothetical protein
MGRPRQRSAAAPNLDAPETIRDLSALTPEQLARAAEQLQRELEAPQTIEARRLKYAALCRIERKLGSRRALRRVFVPPATRARPGSRIWREPQIQPAATPTPARALDGFLGMLEGWKLDWTDAAEIERVGVPEYTPERALGVLLRAFAAGQIARAGPDIAPEAASREQLVLPIREAA